MYRGFVVIMYNFHVFKCRHASQSMHYCVRNVSHLLDLDLVQPSCHPPNWQHFQLVLIFCLRSASLTDEEAGATGAKRKNFKQFWREKKRKRKRQKRAWKKKC